jgi:hypothetical protein
MMGGESESNARIPAAAVLIVVTLCKPARRGAGNNNVGIRTPKHDQTTLHD